MTLAIECSSDRGSLALAHAGNCHDAPWQTAFPAGRGHGGKFFAALQEAMRQLADQPLTEIVIGLGPGSYSGVRQAIAAAIGLGLARGARLSGLPSTVALDTDAPAYHAIGDARRGGFYYTAVDGGACVVEPELVDAAGALARIAAHSAWPVLAEAPLAGLPVTAFVYPIAARLLTALPAARKLPPLEPIYLRAVTITLPRPRPVPASRPT